MPQIQRVFLGSAWGVFTPQRARPATSISSPVLTGSEGASTTMNRMSTPEAVFKPPDHSSLVAERIGPWAHRLRYLRPIKLRRAAVWGHIRTGRSVHRAPGAIHRIGALQRHATCPANDNTAALEPGFNTTRDFAGAGATKGANEF